MRTLRHIARLVFAGLLIPAAAMAGQSQTPSTPPYTPAPASGSAPYAVETVLRANSNLVLEDVVVTDHGNPIHGLAQSRFHVLEDGREQAITSVDEHQPAPAPASAARAVPLPPGTYTNVSAYPEASAVNVLLLDGLNTATDDQMDVYGQMLQYLGKIQPGTTLAVFTLNSQLRMVAGFTTDAAELTRDIKDKKYGAQPTLPIGGMSSRGIGGQEAGAFNSFQTDKRVRATLYAMQQLAGYLKDIPGRKNLIWFSGSFPVAIGPDASLESPSQATRDIARDYGDEVRAANKLLTLARIAVYPVYSKGMRGAAHFAEQDAMEEIADQTGGRAFFNTNGFKESMEKAIEDGSSYYTIAYVPAGKKLDGQFRKIQVRLDNGNYNLAYRRGYYADPPDKDSAPKPGTSSATTAAILHGAPPSTQIHFQARVLPATDPVFEGSKLPEGPAGEMAAALKGPKQQFIVDLLADPRGLAFDTTPDGMHQAYAEYTLVAFDGDGNRVNYAERGFRMKLDPESYKKMMVSGVPLRQALDLPAGQFSLRIAVQCPAASRTGSLEIPLKVAGQ
jgi:VWFA-related protein